MPAPRVAVITVSTRASAGQYADTAGPALAAGLADAGLAVTGVAVVPDQPEGIRDDESAWAGSPVALAIRAAIAEGAEVVVTCGGTGLAPQDRTPESTRTIIDLELPGIAEALRAGGVASGVATAMLSRGVAGVASAGSGHLPANSKTGVVVVNVAGSRGAATDAARILGPVLRHAVSQLRGEQHQAGISG
jgi:molybdenum cofactor synthesis domain-containing protein